MIPRKDNYKANEVWTHLLRCQCSPLTIFLQGTSMRCISNGMINTFFLKGTTYNQINIAREISIFRGSFLIKKALFFCLPQDRIWHKVMTQVRFIVGFRELEVEAWVMLLMLVIDSLIAMWARWSCWTCTLSTHYMSPARVPIHSLNVI